MLSLIVLGLTLGLDSLRASISLGTMHPSLARQRQIVLVFGLCDGVAPLLGLAIGTTLRQLLGQFTEYVGGLALGLCGLYMIFLVLHHDTDDAIDNWLVFGIPISLSIDNLIAGVGLGVMGFPILVSAFVIGVISSLMSFVGLSIGQTIGKIIPARTELLGAIALLLLAVRHITEIL